MNTLEWKFCFVKLYVPAVVVGLAVVIPSVVVASVVTPPDAPLKNNKCIIVNVSNNARSVLKDKKPYDILFKLYLIFTITVSTRVFAVIFDFSYGRRAIRG